MYIRQLFLFLLVSVFLSADIVFGQDYSWKNYSIADGLPQTQVVSVMQDSYGFLWLGTKNGFSIFDGIEFENYSSKDGLDFDHIAVIQEFREGEVYIGTYGGLNLVKDGKITTLIQGLGNGTIFYLIDNEGNLWFNHGEEGLCIFENGRFVKEAAVYKEMPEGEILEHIIVRRSDGKLVFFSSFGNVFIPDTDGFRKIRVGEKFLSVLEGEDGRYYACTEKAMYTIDENGVIPIPFLSGKYILLHVSGKEELYLTEFSKRDVLFLYKNGHLTRFSTRFGLISSLFFDTENNMWLGTDKGLWTVQNRAFENYKTNPENDDYTWTVMQDKNGDFIFGSYNYSLQKMVNGSFIDIPVNFLNLQYPISYYSGGIKTGTGDLLITTALGLLKWDGEKLNWMYHPEPPTTILYVYDDKKYCKYLLGTSRYGLVEMDAKGNYVVYDDREPWEHTEMLTSILRDKYDRIWISGKKGISIREDNQWRHLPDDKDSVPIGAISMLLDPKQNIWLGSNDGLYFYDYHRMQKIDNQALNTQIGVLNLTDAGELIVGGIGAVGIIDLEDFYASGNAHVRIYDHNSGFLGDECKHNSSFKDNEGNIWICTSNRVVKIIPDYLNTNPFPPRVYIKSIINDLDNSEWKIFNESGKDGNQLTLERKHNSLRFNYHAISLSAPLGVRYQTMLEGYDEGWSDETAERYRNYTNLHGGHYTFKVKARNNDGIWSEEPASVVLYIKPTWHELLSVKIGGIFGALLAAAGIGYLYSERRRKLLQRNARIEHDMARLQFKSLKGMLDPHFTFNAINAIASMMYRGEKDEAYGYFSKFSRLIRNLFEHTDMATRTLQSELEFVTIYLELEKMRYGDKFDFTINIEDQVDKNREIPKLIIQIYVENAIKHGLNGMEAGGMLEVNIRSDEQALHIRVRDNGIGREKSKLYRDSRQSLGKASYIIRDYFELLNRFNDPKISVETSDLYHGHTPSGTEVHVSIPHNFKFSL